MLRPAQLYEDQLIHKEVSSWYDMSNIYLYGYPGTELPNLQDNNYDCHRFVSINTDSKIIGYISYRISWVSMSVDHLGIISYDKGNPTFLKDLLQVIHNIFYVYNLNRLEWICFADNPALRSYRTFVSKYGGREVGCYRQRAKLLDGQLHDAISFEILKEDIKRNFILSETKS